MVTNTHDHLDVAAVPGRHAMQSPIVLDVLTGAHAHVQATAVRHYAQGALDGHRVPLPELCSLLGDAAKYRYLPAHFGLSGRRLYRAKVVR